MSPRDDFVAAARSDDVARAAPLLALDPTLANTRVRGDAPRLDGQVWENSRLVDMHPDDQRDAPVLHHAAFHGYADLTRLLIERGADVDAWGYENNHENTQAIMLAAWEGGIEVLRIPLEAGADPNSRSSNGVTPLSTALVHGKLDRTELLREYGAEQ